jgi:hypothetical protein
MTTPRPPRPKQSVAIQLRDDLLRLLWQKFYADDPAGPKEAARCFGQDRAKLLGWVILWPARFMSGKGFTVTGERYKSIFSNIIIEAVRHGNTSRLGYRPAWLKMVMQSHFKKHWEQYYDEAKGVRAQAEHALHVLGQLPRVAPPNPVEELAAAGALLARTKPAKKPRIKEAANLEFNL